MEWLGAAAFIISQSLCIRKLDAARGFQLSSLTECRVLAGAVVILRLHWGGYVGKSTQVIVGRLQWLPWYLGM